MTQSKVQVRPMRGDIWLVQFSNRPNDPHLPRPALVISTDFRNENASSVLAIPISGEERGRFLPTHVFLPKGGGSGLTKDSRALCEQIASLEKDCFLEHIGKLHSTVLSSVVAGVKKAVEE